MPKIDIPLEIIGGLIPGGSAPKIDKPQAIEAQVMELQQAYEAYVAPCPFRPGQLVTPKRSSYLKGVGEPHVILEVLPEPVRYWAREGTDVSSMANGSKLDIRVVAYSDSGHMVPYMGESWNYEPWYPTVDSRETRQ